MKPDPAERITGIPHPPAQHGVRTLSKAKEWLAELMGKGAREVTLKEPVRPVGGGLVLVRASVVREDGVRVNVEVYCVDDREPPKSVDLFPLPPAVALPGLN